MVEIWSKLGRVLSENCMTTTDSQAAMKAPRKFGLMQCPTGRLVAFGVVQIIVCPRGPVVQDERTERFARQN
jgi:hypothetical protein